MILRAERRPLLGVGDCLVERGLRETDRDGGDAEPAGIQCAERDLQTLALGADPAFGGHEGVVVVRGGGRHGAQTHLLLGLAEGQALGVLGDQEAGDAPRPSPVRAKRL